MTIVVRSSAICAFVLACLAAAACGHGGNGSGGGGSGGSGGTGGGVPCGEHPTSCPDAQTCWYSGRGDFECMLAGAGAEGEKCKPLLDQPTCAHGLLCVQESGGSDGVCTPLCDPTTAADTCGAKMCFAVITQDNAQTHVCH